jgi:nuclear cap-binding protein subunit 1
VYYHSLIVELCRLSPSTVAPALGKSVRRLYGALGDVGPDAVTIRLEPEGIRRFAEWFGVHLSNFGSLWAWKDWYEYNALLFV